MGLDLRSLEGNKNPKNIFSTLRYNHKFYKNHPDYFDPEGLLIFCGPQGSGKTLSAVQYIINLCIEYPRAILCTNTKIKGLPRAYCCCAL